MPAHLNRTPLRFIFIALYGCRLGIGADIVGSYVVDYPTAEHFVPPIEGFFEEVASTVGRVGRRTFRHQPNGGYGLAVRGRVGDKNLIHLGADVGWYRVGNPVMAVSDGVVRVVQQPQLKDRKSKEKKTVQNQAPVLHWGGVVAIEHRLPDGRYVTSVYGHLDQKLLVSTGDVVKSGQPIGTIGNTRVNGGYKPHLHFGVRDGRMAEKGRELIPININGQNAILKIHDITEERLLVTGAEELPQRFNLSVGDKTFEVQNRGGTAQVLADILWHIQPPSFAIVGYGLSVEGWRDPVQFLRDPTEE